jgi:hypothetical protein
MSMGLSESCRMDGSGGTATDAPSPFNRISPRGRTQAKRFSTLTCDYGPMQLRPKGDDSSMDRVIREPCRTTLVHANARNRCGEAILTLRDELGRAKSLLMQEIISRQAPTRATDHYWGSKVTNRGRRCPTIALRSQDSESGMLVIEGESSYRDRDEQGMKTAPLRIGAKRYSARLATSIVRFACDTSSCCQTSFRVDFQVATRVMRVRWA